ncbi:hypothetical protein [Deinococcus fonticola]|uniref:hypothetical protein n=1 Tax=Deinococcus fonticola TaxID=2528713 RepID=UPI001F11684D|nr:hypothetical protein [Deinococcus fonticola]
MSDALSLTNAPFLSLSVPRVTSLYALTLLAVTLYWWGRVWREGRAGRVPRVAWWSLPGLLLLLFAPILEQPTFFALGAFLLLLGEFWPRAYRRAPGRPGWWWPLLGGLLGAALLLSVTRSLEAQRPALAAALALLLGGGAGLASALSWPRRATPSTLPGWPRWVDVTVPEWPDLSLTLTGNGAELRNVSASALNVSGWSPARTNGWLLVRNTRGEPVRTLAAGEAAWLPIEAHASGVRVWYNVGDDQQEPRLFRADWTPPTQGQSRVLN